MADEQWKQSPARTWHLQGWSVVECDVTNTSPHSRGSHQMHRAFPPGSARHVGSFSMLTDAKRWVEKQLLLGDKCRYI